MIMVVFYPGDNTCFQVIKEPRATRWASMQGDHSSLPFWCLSDSFLIMTANTLWIPCFHGGNDWLLQHYWKLSFPWLMAASEVSHLAAHTPSPVTIQCSESWSHLNWIHQVGDWMEHIDWYCSVSVHLDASATQCMVPNHCLLSLVFFPISLTRVLFTICRCKVDPESYRPYIKVQDKFLHTKGSPRIWIAPPLLTFGKLIWFAHSNRHWA